MEEQVVEWSFSALEMLSEIYDYLAEYSKDSAEKYVDELLEYTRRLEKYPESCALCRNNQLKSAGLRCCKFKKHIIVYEIFPSKVVVLAVIHSRSNPDDLVDIVGI
ncbi:MAG: type II toxin-antitoxin system RelE/ParE family toxin [Bacteroidota bacterium]